MADPILHYGNWFDTNHTFIKSNFFHSNPLRRVMCGNIKIWIDFRFDIYTTCRAFIVFHQTNTLQLLIQGGETWVLLPLVFKTLLLCYQTRTSYRGRPRISILTFLLNWDSTIIDELQGIYELILQTNIHTWLIITIL